MSRRVISLKVKTHSRYLMRRAIGTTLVLVILIGLLNRVCMKARLGLLRLFGNKLVLSAMSLVARRMEARLRAVREIRGR